MTINERRILSEMLRRGPVSKGGLIEALGLSWATVVKLVNRLEAAGIVVRAGTAKREVPVGKNSYLYQLSSSGPVAIGVDVEFASTHLVLTNLKGETLAERSEPTRAGSTVQTLVRFLDRAIRSFVAEEVPDGGRLAGVGVVIPAFIVSSGRDIYGEVQELLDPALSVPIRVDNVVRAYTLYTAQKFSHPDSFIMVTVRSGIGCGIITKGKLYRGDTGLSGEISQLKVAPNGESGGSGTPESLETVVNEHVLYRRYRESGLSSDETQPSGEGELRAVLPDLFAKARAGQTQALAIVEDAARSLSEGLATLLITFDIPQFYLSGHFGPSGKILEPLIERNLDGLVDQRFLHKVEYRPLDNLGFVMGAAKLILNDYLEAPVAHRAPVRPA